MVTTQIIFRNKGNAKVKSFRKIGTNKMRTKPTGHASPKPLQPNTASLPTIGGTISTSCSHSSDSFAAFTQIEIYIWVRMTQFSHRYERNGHLTSIRLSTTWHRKGEAPQTVTHRNHTSLCIYLIAPPHSQDQGRAFFGELDTAQARTGTDAYY